MMAVWTFLLGGLAFLFELHVRREEYQRALLTARAIFQQVVIERKWNAFHGGVYVPVTSQVPPNKYLPLKNRDLTADNGLRLTKVNPSYMTRQIAELAMENTHGFQPNIHITSLNPIRPENKAAAWEERWLKSFEKEAGGEYGEFIDDDGVLKFRYMAPLRVAPECLSCHAKQGYKVGDIRGGISISLPYPSTHGYIHIASYASVTLLGLALIFTGGIRYDEKQRLFEATFDSPVPTSVTSKSHTILMANKSYWSEFGPLPDGKKNIKCHEHRPGESCHTDECPLFKIMSGATEYVGETIKKKDGKARHFIITAKPLFDSRGKLVGSVECFQDITARKQSEKAIEELNRQLEARCITDGLTGIANRRRFDEALAKEYSRHARSGAELSLIMLDIDHFKGFNDCYGHVMGDDCLRQIADVLSGCATRPLDLVARYGGEEFVCILPETGSQGAVAIAEEIRQGIIARAIPHEESSAADFVTASIGVVTVRCGDGAATDVVAQADKLLYRAKTLGRNRVEFEAPAVEVKEDKGSLVQLVWQNSFCCGNQVIDSQHKALFDISNSIFEAILADRSCSETTSMFARLLYEVNEHFTCEEKIIAAAGFPCIEQHSEEHAELLKKGFALLQEFKECKLTSGDVFQFLVNEVVVLHLLKADREYFPFIDKAALQSLG